MKCPTCGTWTIVLETRISPTRNVRRRRLCANEHNYTTEEVVVPREVLEQERQARLKAAREKRMESIRARKSKAAGETSS